MSEFKVGDKIKIFLSAYNVETGTVHHIYDDGMLSYRRVVGDSISNIIVHPKQVRKLKKVKSVRVTRGKLVKGWDEARAIVKFGVGYSQAEHSLFFAAFCKELGL